MLTYYKPIHMVYLIHDDIENSYETKNMMKLCKKNDILYEIIKNK